MADFIEGSIATPLSPHAPFAEVRRGGATLRGWLKRGSGAQFRTLLETHGLVVFRGCAALTPREEVEVNKLAGYHAPDFDEGRRGVPGGWNAAAAGVGVLPDQPEVLCQGNVLLRDHHGLDGVQLRQLLTLENEGFHADGVHNQHARLPVLTSMRCIVAPDTGGETLFACSRRALTDADDASLLRRLTVRYAYSDSDAMPTMRGGVVRVGARRPRIGDQKVTRTAHPLVRRHVSTGDEAIYVSCARVASMDAPADARGPAVSLDECAAYALLERVLGAACAPPQVYAHRWRVGDFAIWDNRLLLHSPSAMCQSPRLHHRVRLDGDDATANADLM
jgi:hypothetical protein